MRSAALLLIAAMAAPATRADEVFRWVDENGKVHYGDSIPDRYKAKAGKIEDRVVAPTPEQRQEADERLARDKQRAEAAARAREAAANKASSAATPAAATPTAKPVARVAEGCQEQWRKYEESLACFEKFRTIRGAPGRGVTGNGIKPEAFDHCIDVKQPKGCAPPQPPSDTIYLPGAEPPYYPPR